MAVDQRVCSTRGHGAQLPHLVTVDTQLTTLDADNTVAVVMV